MRHLVAEGGKLFTKISGRPNSSDRYANHRSSGENRADICSDGSSTNAYGFRSPANGRNQRSAAWPPLSYTMPLEVQSDGNTFSPRSNSSSGLSLLATF